MGRKNLDGRGLKVPQFRVVEKIPMPEDFPLRRNGGHMPPVSLEVEQQFSARILQHQRFPLGEAISGRARHYNGSCLIRIR